jgi:hypothetical protein
LTALDAASETASVAAFRLFAVANLALAAQIGFESNS